MPRLRRSRTTTPGIRRIRRGRGFSYLDPDGAVLRDPATRERIDRLAVPPAWRDVWISPHDHDHIQVTGVDAADRRQYLYHPAWRARADAEKFDRMLDLAATMPRARRSVTADLRAPGLTRERVLAGAFRLLDTGALRVGSPRYADEHGSVGLCTLLVAHAAARAGEVRLRFPAKSGQRWTSTLADAELAGLVAELGSRGRRARLLAWRDETGRAHPIRPEDINEDIRRAVAEAMRCAAAALGNTPAIARASYVDPRLVDRYLRGETVRAGARSVERELIRLLGDR